MAQIDHDKSDEMRAKKIGIFAVDPYYQSSEFIDPGKRSFTCEAILVDIFIEKPFATTFDLLSISYKWVFRL